MAQFLTDTQINSVYELYIGYFNRAPEAGGLNYWSNYYLGQVNAGKTDAAIQKDIANQFYSAAVQYNIYSAGTPVEDFIKASYLNALGRTSVDDAGMTYWTAKLTSGEVSRGEFVQKLISDAKGFASDATYGWVSKYLDNRMAVAKAFAAANTTTGDAAITAGKAALSAVTPAAVQAGQTPAQALAAAGFGGTSVPGQTFTLTKGVDDLKGTGGNDTIIAAIDGGNQESNTLNTGDVIEGNGGTDTLQLTRATAGAPAVTLKGIETIQIRDNNGAGFDLANADTAVASLINAGSGANTRFDNAAGNVAVSVKDINTNGQSTTVTFNAGVLAGAADTANVTLNNVSAGAGQSHTLALTGLGATANGFENVSIKTEGAASSIRTLTVNDGTANPTTLSKLTISGDKNLTLGTQTGVGTAVDFVATGGTVDAAGFTGNLAINLDNGDNVTVTGGKGNDTFLFGASLTSTDKVDGGDGTDTLGANTFGALQAAFAAGTISNIEAIRIQQAIADTGATLDVSKAGNVNAVTIAGIGANANTLTSLADNSTLTLTANGTGNLTTNIKDASLAGTANTLNINLGSASDAAVVTAGTITAAGVETINVATAGTVASGAGTNTLTIASNSDLSKLVVTGNEDVTVTFQGGTAALRTFDANAATGVQDTSNITFSASGAALTGGNKADVLTGGAGNDTIVGGAGNDQITGGAGSDVLTGGEGSDTFVMSDNGNNADLTNPIVDTLKDFALGSGGDALNIAAVTNRPVADAATSMVKVTALNGALPSTTTPTDGRAELIVLDSSVTDLQAANASALNAKLFNLSSTGYGNVLVAYSDSATGNVRLATAVIAGGDITTVRDFAVLEGVTTAALATGFHANNLAGFAAGTNYNAAGALNANLTTGAFTDAANATYTTLAALNAAGFGTLTRGAFALNLTAAGDNAGVTYNATTGAVTNADGASANLINYVDATSFTGSGFADTVTVAPNVNNGHTYDAGAGIDTLVVSGAAGGNLVVNTTTNAFTIGGAGTSTFTNFENVNTAGVTGGNVTVTGGVNSDTFVVGATQTDLALGNAALNAVAVNATALANGVNLTLATGHASDTVTVTGLTGDLVATTLASTLVVNLADNTVDNTISVTTGTAANTTVQGGVAGDTVTVDNAAANGVDTLSILGAATYNVTNANVGGNANVIAFAGTAASSVAVVTAGNGNDLTVNNTGTGALTIAVAGGGNTGDNDLTISGTAGTVTTVNGAGLGISNGADDVTISNGSVGTFNVNFTTAGAGAANTIVATGTNTTATVNVDATNLVEILTITGSNAVGVTNLSAAGQAEVNAKAATGDITVSGADSAAHEVATGVGNDSYTVTGTGNTAVLFSGAAGTDTFTGAAGTGIDIILGGQGRDIINGGGGADVIQWGSADGNALDIAGAAVTEAISNATAANYIGANADSITLGATDVLTFDTSAWQGNYALLDGDGNAATVAAGSAAVAQGAANTTLAAATNVIFYRYGTYTDATAVTTAVQTANSKIDFNGASTAASNGAMLIVWDTGVSSDLAVGVLRFAAGDADSSTAVVEQIATLVGVADFTGIAATNFNIIA